MLEAEISDEEDSDVFEESDSPNEHNMKEGSEASISVEAKDKVGDIHTRRTRSSKSISIDDNSLKEMTDLNHPIEPEKNIDKEEHKDTLKDKLKNKLHKKKGK